MDTMVNSKTPAMGDRRVSLDSAILVVSADDALSEQIAALLGGAGFSKVIIAKTSKLGRRVLLIPSDVSEPPPETPPGIELVICDARLDTDRDTGADFCELVKDKYPYIPVLLICTHDEEDFDIPLLDCGADDFIYCPIDRAELVARAKVLLAKTIVSVDREQTSSFDMPRKIPFIGDRVDSYLILDSLGMGKTSLIYKVLDTRDNTVYAMKLLSGAAGNYEEAVKRFEYEIEIMSQIDHPNVIGYHERGSYRGATYLVMEYLNGIDLEELIISRGRLPESTVFSIAFDLACALSQIHDKGIVHRDIKLKNSIYIPTTKQVKLCDFGIAQIPNMLELTQEGMIVGTPIYMAPENFRGEKATIASDIYSYGATVYHIATNTPPFVAENYKKLYEQHSLKAPPAIESIRPTFSPLWSELIITRCLAKQPIRRPGSMGEVLAALLAIKKNKKT